jgi:hypothetical protein
MKRSQMFRLFVLGFAALTLASCNDDDDDNPDPTPGNDPEVITTVNITFTESEGVIPTQTFTWSDPDGEGGNAPTIDAITLQAPANYLVSIEVLDESDPNDVEDITAEILEEGAEHQFFFIGSETALDVLGFAYNDADENGKPIGLETIWTVTGPTTGEATVRVVLRHELDKGASGVSSGMIENAGGDTDIDIVFDFVAQ